MQTVTTPAELRAACRAGWAAPTSGHATGFTQCNLIALPKDWAWDFLLFAQRNPKPCPVLDLCHAVAVEEDHKFGVWAGIDRTKGTSRKKGAAK